MAAALFELKVVGLKVAALSEFKVARLKAAAPRLLAAALIELTLVRLLAAALIELRAAAQSELTAVMLKDSRQRRHCLTSWWLVGLLVVEPKAAVLVGHLVAGPKAAALAGWRGSQWSWGSWRLRWLRSWRRGTCRLR